MSTQDKALYTGTSSRGDIGEALEAAVALARESMQTDIVHWKLVSLEGEYGGFIDKRVLKVSISATSGAA